MSAERTVIGLERMGCLSGDGRPLNGVIRAQHEVHCAGCEEAYLGLGRTVAEARTELRKEGWRTLRDLWVCPSCWERGHGPPGALP